MPKLNLSDEELELIKRVRAKTAVDRAFNEGLERAVELLKADPSRLEELIETPSFQLNLTEAIATWRSELLAAINSERRDIKL